MANETDSGYRFLLDLMQGAYDAHGANAATYGSVKIRNDRNAIDE